MAFEEPEVEEGARVFSGVLVGTCVLVGGETYEARDAIKAIGDGSWNKHMNAWIFPESKRAEVLAALPGCKTGTDPAQERARFGTPSENANAKLRVAPHKRAVLVSGDTKAVKEQLKSLQGSWNGALQGWIFPSAKKAAVLELLRADPTNTVAEGAEAEAGESSSSNTKVRVKAESKAGASDSDDAPIGNSKKKAVFKAEMTPDADNAFAVEACEAESSLPAAAAKPQPPAGSAARAAPTQKDVRLWCKNKYGSSWWEGAEKTARMKEAREALTTGLAKTAPSAAKSARQSKAARPSKANAAARKPPAKPKPARGSKRARVESDGSDGDEDGCNEHEDDAHEPVGDGSEDDGIDRSNIVRGKRRRAAVSYTQTKVDSQDEESEDDDDDDEAEDDDND